MLDTDAVVSRHAAPVYTRARYKVAASAVRLVVDGVGALASLHMGRAIRTAPRMGYMKVVPE